MTVEVKICGLKTPNEIKAAINNKAGYIGFVFFHKSPRNVNPKKAGQLSKTIKGKAKTVAVVVDITDAEIDTMLKEFKPDYIQCHGSESPKRVKEIKDKYGVGVIKAISVRSSDDVAKAMDYAEYADMILFDAKAPSALMPGGNGLSFDWSLIKGRNFDVPWMLSGGLNVQNVKNAIRTTGATMVDVSSSIESEPGVKDVGLIEEFIRNAKTA